MVKMNLRFAPSYINILLTSNMSIENYAENMDKKEDLDVYEGVPVEQSPVVFTHQVFLPYFEK